jgi:hypothetical protein
MRKFVICTPLQILFGYERRKGWAVYMVRTDKKRNARDFGGKPVGKKNLEDTCRWEDNIKMDLEETR